MQESDWHCGNVVTPNHQKKPFDDVRVRRALALAIDQWHSAPALSKIANVKTVGGIVFPGSPLAATKAELETIAGYWPVEFERHILDAQAHELVITYWNRIVPLRSYVKGWKVSPSHYVNQDLANVWLDK